MDTNGHAPETTLTVAEALQVFAQMTHRLSLRSGVTFETKRDLYEVLGYARDLTYQDYYARYRRGGIAQALIREPISETWRRPPVLREVDKPDEMLETPFETTWSALTTRLKLWKILKRVDRLASIGRYAVLVLGLRGQTNWSTAATPGRGPEDLLQVQVFSEEHAQIVELVSDDTSVLFGKPLYYHIDFSRGEAPLPGTLASARPALTGLYGQLVTVHASRVIHVAYDALEDDIVGTPSLEAVWNYLDDLDKIVGGTSEMVWQDAKRRLVMALRDGAVLDEHDAAKLDDRIEDFIHGLRNVLKVQGLDITQLEGKVPDASNNVDKLVELIAGTKRIPKRRLLGTEHGELAGDQDEGNFSTTIASRQVEEIEPILLRPLIDQCLALRVLPVPTGGYAVEWQPLIVETEQEKADTALAWTRAIQAYAGPGGSPQEVMPLEIWLSDVLGWAPEQVERIMDRLGEQEAARQRAAPPPAPDDQDEDDEPDLTDED